MLKKKMENKDEVPRYLKLFNVQEKQENNSRVLEVVPAGELPHP